MVTNAATSIGKAPGYRRIATEEAWAPPELIRMYRKELADKAIDDPGFHSLWGFFAGASERANLLVDRIQDLGDRRIADMDATGIDMQIVSLTCPGVQLFDAATATTLAAEFNDQLAEGVRRHPTRFAGLAAIAPQEPQRAVKELERAVSKLGLKGAIVNSHTRGEYLDDPKFWDIFAAAEALGVPIYLHPNTPSKAMIEPFLARGLDGAVFGFSVETGLHALRIIAAGVFDRFPRLQIVLGHLGEALPYWLSRLDFMHGIITRTNRYGAAAPKLAKPMSAYLRENFHYTTSGMGWTPPIMFVHQVIGADRLLYAMDYPYQYVAEEVVEQDNLPLSVVDKHLFFQGNAERLFSLKR
jgi:2,3-dihydroxybenzoate decarboxylase